MEKLDSTTYKVHFREFIRNKKDFSISLSKESIVNADDILQEIKDYFSSCGLTYFFKECSLDEFFQSSAYRVNNIDADYILYFNFMGVIEVIYNVDKIEMMSKNVTYQNYEKRFELLIDNKKSFKIKGVSLTNTLEVCARLETYIEANKLTCRIYTKNRGVMAFFPPLAVASLGALVAHNLATFNPDYEIARDIVNNTIEVTYKKE